MAVKLHRCANTWVKLNAHPCWRVEKALRDAGIEHEVVKHGYRDRDETESKTGQRKFPWLELEDGTAIREESAQLAERIRAGNLR